MGLATLVGGVIIGGTKRALSSVVVLPDALADDLGFNRLLKERISTGDDVLGVVGGDDAPDVLEWVLVVKGPGRGVATVGVGNGGSGHVKGAVGVFEAGGLELLEHHVEVEADLAEPFGGGGGVRSVVGVSVSGAVHCVDHIMNGMGWFLSDTVQEEALGLEDSPHFTVNLVGMEGCEVFELLHDVGHELVGGVLVPVVGCNGALLDKIDADSGIGDKSPETELELDGTEHELGSVGHIELLGLVVKVRCSLVLDKVDGGMRNCAAAVAAPDVRTRGVGARVVDMECNRALVGDREFGGEL